MSKPRVLIVEDEPMVAMDLESIVLGVIAADVVVVASVSGARLAMAAPLDFALLDIEVTDGRTFEIARDFNETGRHSFSSRALGRKRFLRPAWRAIHFQAVRRRQIERFCVAISPEGFPIEPNRDVIATRPRNPEAGGRPATPGCSSRRAGGND